MLMSPLCGLALSNSTVHPLLKQLHRAWRCWGVGSSCTPSHSGAGCIIPISLEKQLKIARGDVPQAVLSQCQVWFILQQAGTRAQAMHSVWGQGPEIGGHRAAQPQASSHSWGQPHPMTHTKNCSG